MKLLITLIVCSYLLQDCTTKKTETAAGGLFTPPHEWPVPDSVSRTLKLQIENGHIEYFTANDSKFRFQKSTTTPAKYDLQVLQHDSWVTNLTLSMPQYTFFLTPDFDMDGNFDLSYIKYGNFEIYFFDDQKKQFITTPIIFPYDQALLDSSRVIYGANNKTYNEWDIAIFSLKDRTIYNLLRSKIFFENNDQTGSHKATYALVYTCSNGISTDTVLVDKIIINKEWADFGLNKFMKDLVHDKKYLNSR